MTEKKRMRSQALIVSGGHTDLEQLQEQVKKLRDAGGLLIAADSGLEILDQLIRSEEASALAEEGGRIGLSREINCLPDVAVGDFDSVDPQVLNHFLQREGIRFERHRAEKNETDTELAFTIAQEMGVTHITLMGATGTRLDHTISNVHLLKAAMNRGLQCQILDTHNRIRMTAERMVFHRGECPYPFVSFLPLTMEVKGITLTGFKYPLKEHDLALGQECGLCISNELVAEEAVLELKEGLLLVVEARD